MGETVRVSDDGLRDLAGRCDTAAAAICDTRPPAAAGPPFQATSAAVNHGHTLVTAAAGRLSARAAGTGGKLRAAADGYTRTDDASAAQLTAVGRLIEA